MRKLFVGLMSGTSVDGIDAALVDLSDGIQVIAGENFPYPSPVRSTIKQLCLSASSGLTRPSSTSVDAIDQLGHLDTQLAELFANATLQLLDKNDLSPQQILAIGSHGQTIRHRPNHEAPFTLQIGDPNRIVELTGITTVADFRRRDMAAGGQAAPLLPALHDHLFRTEQHDRVVLNLGGIANVTLLSRRLSDPIMGWDTGPANTLMDGWIEQHQNRSYDDSGKWAASGQLLEDLLNELLADDYFSLPAPKSTGPEYFSRQWLNGKIRTYSKASATDVQRTLLEFTAQSVANAVQQSGFGHAELLCCGGGRHNRFLLSRLKSLLPDAVVTTTDSLGVNGDWLEASCFAWLAQQTLQRQSGNLPSVTGAKGPRILGGIYFA